MKNQLTGKRPRCWEKLKAGGEGDDRGWESFIASLTQCTWVWASSGSWLWTGKPGMLQSMRSQRDRHDWVTELNWTGCISICKEGVRKGRNKGKRDMKFLCWYIFTHLNLHFQEVYKMSVYFFFFSFIFISWRQNVCLKCFQQWLLKQHVSLHVDRRLF